MFEPELAFQIFFEKLDALVARASVSLRLAKKVRDAFPADRISRFLEENHLQSTDLQLALLCSEMLRYLPVPATDCNPTNLATLYLEPMELERSFNPENTAGHVPAHALSNSLFLVNRPGKVGKSHLLSQSTELRQLHRSVVPGLAALGDTNHRLLSSMPDSRKKRAKTGFSLAKQDPHPRSLASVKERQLRNDSATSTVSNSRPGIFSQGSRKHPEQTKDIWKVYQGIISRKEQRRQRAEHTLDQTEKTSADIISQVKAALYSLRQPGGLFSEKSTHSHNLQDLQQDGPKQIFLQTTHKKKPSSSDKRSEAVYWSEERRVPQALRDRLQLSTATDVSPKNIYSQRLQRRSEMMHCIQDSDRLRDTSHRVSEERSVEPRQSSGNTASLMKRRQGPAQVTTVKLDSVLKKKASMITGKSSQDRAPREVLDLRPVRFQDPSKIGSLVKNSEGHFIIKR